MQFCLVVDQSDVIRKVARKIVEGSGHIAVEADSGKEALRLCRASMPQMIMVDAHLSDMSVFDFLAELHRVECESFPQILYCTTEADPQDLGRAYRSGVSKHLLKPFDRYTLEPALGELSRTAEAFV